DQEKARFSKNLISPMEPEQIARFDQERPDLVVPAREAMQIVLQIFLFFPRELSDLQGSSFEAKPGWLLGERFSRDGIFQQHPRNRKLALIAQGDRDMGNVADLGRFPIAKASGGYIFNPS